MESIKLQQTFELEDSILINFIFLTDKEKEMIRNWRNHETIRRWMYSEHVISIEEHNVFIENLKNDNKNSYWLIKHKVEDDYIGVIYLNRIDFINKNACLGIYVNPFLKKTGIGRILIKYLIKLTFNILKFHTLKLEVLENNEKAINFYKKSGFSEEGRLKEFISKDKKWNNVIIMGIINHEGDNYVN
jgi:UDP-4-amino-4,6-dideoxy-N-acetyl-beta-L-altrosamine N-acetyltransferase